MKGDFSRDTFSPRRHYNAVLMQQGRVQVDADWNEQRAIDRHRIETEARDLIGASGGQVGNAGFEISVREGDTLSIGPGNLYVGGILCQNEEPVLFEEQVDLPGVKAIDLFEEDLEVGLVYLDVWERHITAFEDDHIREVALGGPDTATRSRTVWQAKVLQVEADTSNIVALQPLLEQHIEIVSELASLQGDPANKEEIDKLRFALSRTNNSILELLGVNCDSPFADELTAANPPSTGQLLAKALPPPASPELPCILPPSAGYEGLENRLYRVEIHTPGDRDTTARFKWSRDNGSVTTGVLKVTPNATGTEIAVRDLGRDETFRFANGQFVELLDDAAELSGQAGPLVQIVNVEPANHTITVNETLPEVNPQDARDFHYKLRRWDSADPLSLVSPQDGGFVALEEGIQVQFSEGRYNTGDYWLIPARTTTGAIEWPEGQALPPAGINHHYSQLALVMAATVQGERQLLVLSDCRRLFPLLTELTSLFYLGGDGQETSPGQDLPKPLVVGVANGDKPVLGAQVTFAVQAKDAEDFEEYNGELKAEDGNTGKIVVATTNAHGEARCSWTLATDRQSQQVKASLVDGTHLPIYFNANLSAEDEAVAESIRITNVLLGSGQDLPIDGLVPVDALAEGIRVQCDEGSNIDEQTVQGRPTCFVTLEIPYPQNEADQRLWDFRELVGFQPLILAAEVGVGDEEKNSILWKPAENTSRWLRERLFQKVARPNILAHLTLKGNFIWEDKDGTLAYLDGETFGIKPPGGRPIDLRLPSGDGRRGGDFEMWFRLVAQRLLLDSVTLNQGEVVGGGTQVEVRGTVRIFGTAPATPATRISLVSSNPTVVGVPGSVTIPPGQSSADFPVTTRAVRTLEEVTITARLLNEQGAPTGQPEVTTLRVRPPTLTRIPLNKSTTVGRTETIQGTVVLDGPAPTGGVTVRLSSNPPANAQFQQPRVTVPAGSSSTEYRVTTRPVSVDEGVTITGEAEGFPGVPRTAQLTIHAPRLLDPPGGLTLDPPSVFGGSPSTATLRINGPAPPNFTVFLNSTATVPASVTVPQDSDRVTFQVSTNPVSSDVLVRIEARRAGLLQGTADLTVQAPNILDFDFTPPSIPGGEESTGRIRLTSRAPSGTSVALSPTPNNTANFLASIPVSPNVTEITFSATGKVFFRGPPRTVNVTASYLGETDQAQLTVQRAPKEDKEGPKEKDGKAEPKELIDIVDLGGSGPDIASDTPVEPVDETSATARPFIDSKQRPETGRQALEQPAEEEKPRARRRRGTPRQES